MDRELYRAQLRVIWQGIPRLEVCFQIGEGEKPARLREEERKGINSALTCGTRLAVKEEVGSGRQRMGEGGRREPGPRGGGERKPGRGREMGRAQEGGKAGVRLGSFPFSFFSFIPFSKAFFK